MNNAERTIILENVGDCTIGLGDTQNRMYKIAKGAKMRISLITLQDILDYPGSKMIFKTGRAKVSNISRKELFNMGLTDEEINLFLKEELKEEKPVIEEVTVKEEVVEVIEEEKEEEVKEVVTKKATTKKPAAKKSSKRK